MRLFQRKADRPLNCRQVGRRLQRYLDGDLDDLTTRRMIHHLEDCRRCGLEYAVYLAIKSSLARRGDVPADAVVRLQEFGERLVRDGPPPGERWVSGDR
jgi:anti-sigma factor RsiW